MTQPDASAAARISKLWERSRDGVIARAVALETAAAASLAGTLSLDDRRAAESEAHKLAGVAGTFGFHEASPLALEAEAILNGDETISPESAARLAAIGSEVKRQLESGPVSSVQDVDADAASWPTIALFGFEAAVAESIGSAARIARIHVVTGSATAADASAYLTQTRARAALVHIGFDGDGLAAIRSLAATHVDISIFACGDSDDLTSRVGALRAGARGFLPSPLDASDVIDAVRDYVPAFRPRRASILVVGGNDALRDSIKEPLSVLGVDLGSSASASELWTSLAETRPELILIASAPSDVSLAELCRVIRGDPRYAAVPIVVFSDAAQPSADELSAAGADAVVSAALPGPALVARISALLDRAAFTSRVETVDPVTHVLSKRRAVAAARRALAVAARDETPLAVAIVSVNGLGDHDSTSDGDEHLMNIGRALSGAIGGMAILGRWSDHGFLIVLPGATDSEAVERLTAFIEARRGAPGDADNGDAAITVSAGISAFPNDGTDWSTLAESAVAAVEEAAGSHGDSVRTIQQRRAARQAAGMDVVIVEDDSAISTLVEHALHTRGYSTRTITDGVAAAAALGGRVPSIRPRVIVLDLGLPGQDGFAVLRALRQANVAANTRVVVLTARSEENLVAQAVKLGVFDYIVKPFGVGELVKRVRRALEASASSR